MHKGLDTAPCRPADGHLVAVVQCLLNEIDRIDMSAPESPKQGRLTGLREQQTDRRHGQP